MGTVSRRAKEQLDLPFDPKGHADPVTETGAQTNELLSGVVPRRQAGQLGKYASTAADGDGAESVQYHLDPALTRSPLSRYTAMAAGLLMSGSLALLYLIKR